MDHMLTCLPCFPFAWCLVVWQRGKGQTSSETITTERETPLHCSFLPHHRLQLHSAFVLRLGAASSGEGEEAGDMKGVGIILPFPISSFLLKQLCSATYNQSSFKCQKCHTPLCQHPMMTPTQELEALGQSMLGCI